MRTLLALTLTLGLLGAGCGPGNTQRLLRDAVDAKKGTLDDCYAVALTRDASLAGTVRAKLHVAAKTGQVSHVDILTKSGDEEFDRCVEDVLTDIRVEPAAKVNVTVDYVFELVPDEEGGGRVAPR